MFKTAGRITLAAAIGLMALPLELRAENARLSGGSQSISLGDRASFPVMTRPDRSTEFTGWCELVAHGAASIVFDGRHYIPLSEPAVGDMINFNAGQTRRFEMTGTFEANDGAADLSFYYANVPSSFCFAGADCSTVSEGSESVTVSCGQN